MPAPTLYVPGCDLLGVPGVLATCAGMSLLAAASMLAQPPAIGHRVAVPLRQGICERIRNTVDVHQPPSACANRQW